MHSLAKELRKRRLQQGITQEKIAERLSIHRTTYLRYESGEAQPPLETLCRLADILGCTTDILLGRG